MVLQRSRDSFHDLSMPRRPPGIQLMTPGDFSGQAPLAALWLAYFIVHSALASHALKTWMARVRPRWMAGYRLAFNLVAVLALLPVLRQFHHNPGPMLWAWNGPWSWLANGLALAAAIGFMATLRHYDGGEFLGWRQWRERAHTADDREALHISPFHRHVRHPWYACGLVVLWTRDMSAAMLVSALLITAYLVVGARLEERKLLARHGDAYRRYMRRVPGLLPWPGKSLTAAEADALTEKSKESF